MGQRKMTTEQQRFADKKPSTQPPEQAHDTQQQPQPAQGASEAVRRALASCADDAAYLDRLPSH